MAKTREKHRPSYFSVPENSEERNGGKNEKKNREEELIFLFAHLRSVPGSLSIIRFLASVYSSFFLICRALLLRLELFLLRQADVLGEL